MMTWLPASWHASCLCLAFAAHVHPPLPGCGNAFTDYMDGRKLAFKAGWVKVHMVLANAVVYCCGVVVGVLLVLF